MSTNATNNLKQITFFKAQNIKKGWGKEVQIINHCSVDGNDSSFPTGYAGKLLCYENDRAVSSMHCHGVKWETFYVLDGEFIFRYINPDNAEILSKPLSAGDCVDIPPLCQHQVICQKKGIIIEFSSTDRSSDNYRVLPGDSQTK